MNTMRNFLLLIIFLSLSNFGISQLVVELAAFDQKVDKSYFKGFTDVYHVMDQANIHRYFVNATKENAESLVAQGKAIGLNPRIIDMDERKRQCAAVCISNEDLEKIKNIFFDFDRSDLRAESRRRLDLLYIILTENPTYTVEFRAHTDAKGSLEYNEALADRRAASAQSYVLSKGISADRMKTTRYGERAPIAKNELAGGIDTPEGRQLNRRVEVVIYNDKGAQVNLVEEIYVPPYLQN
jgi:outer membrane protein OmpA-like peptidoglycan-associated protein